MVSFSRMQLPVLTLPVLNLCNLKVRHDSGMWWLSVFLGIGMVVCCQVQARDAQAERKLDAEEGMDTLLVLAQEQRARIEQVENYFAVYTHEVVDNAFGHTDQIRTSKGYIQEIRSGSRFLSNSTWKDTYSDGKPEKALTDYQRFVIASDKEFIFWIVGQRIMSLWNMMEGVPLDIEADAHLRSSRVPFIERLYGDGNMVLSDLLRFVESFPNWRLEVYESGISTGEAQSYKIHVIDSERSFPLYRKFNINPDKGYTCSRVTTYNPDGTEASVIDNLVTEQFPGVWWLAKTTFREFASSQAKVIGTNDLPLGQEAPVSVTAEVIFSAFDPYYSPRSTDFSLVATGARDGQRIMLKNGQKGEHVLWHGEAVDRESYTQLVSQLNN